MSCSKKSEKAIKQEKVEVDISTCYSMFDILRDMKERISLERVSLEVDSVLNTKAYKTMFKHYNRDWRPNHLPEDVFKRMILSLGFPEQYTSGENKRADQMLEKWNIYYKDLSAYEKRLQQLDQCNVDEMITRAIKEAQSWLPPEMKIKNFNFFILPHGGSGAFKISESQGYDFLQLPEDMEELEAIIAHECHHTGLQIPTPELRSPSDSVAFRFLTIFVGEGTATKLVNNAPGGNVPPVDNKKKSYIFFYEGVKPLWEKYTASADEIFKRMTESFEKAYGGNLTDKEVDDEMRNYWFFGIMGPAYFVGSELFGAIYHGFGKKGCFRAMRDPRNMFDLYNKSIEKKPQLLSKCPKIPELTVKHALTIGSSKNEKRIKIKLCQDKQDLITKVPFII